MKSYLTPAAIASSLTPPGLDSTELFGLPMMVPNDFAMEYTTGPVRSHVGPQAFVRLRPLAPRTWTIELGERAHAYARDSDEAIHQVVQIGHSDVLELYHEVLIQDFYRLRSNYTNPAVFAGGRSSLRVVANGDTKVVCVSNTTVQEFRDVVAVLYELAVGAAH